jgi:hypothetical protein
VAAHKQLAAGVHVCASKAVDVAGHRRPGTRKNFHFAEMPFGEFVQVRQKVSKGDSLAEVSSPDIGMARDEVRRREDNRAIEQKAADCAAMIARNVETLLDALAAALGGADDRLLGTPIAMMVIAFAALARGPLAAPRPAWRRITAIGALALALGGLTQCEGAAWRAGSRLAEVHAQSIDALKSADPRRPVVLLTYPSRLGGALVFSDDVNAALGDDLVALGPLALGSAAELDALGTVEFVGPRAVRLGAVGDAFDLRGVSAGEVATLGAFTVRALDVSPRGELLRYELAWPPGMEPLLLRAGPAGFEPGHVPR